MADTGDTRKRLQEVAAQHGLYVDGYSPGDGKTRYKFIDGHGIEDWSQSGELSYFGASGSRLVYTALGLAESWAWLRGFIAGQSTQERHEAIERADAYRKELGQ